MQGIIKASGAWNEELRLTRDVTAQKVSWMEDAFSFVHYDQRVLSLDGRCLIYGPILFFRLH